MGQRASPLLVDPRTSYWHSVSLGTAPRSCSPHCGNHWFPRASYRDRGEGGEVEPGGHV
jgi:hypothetical protein